MKTWGYFAIIFIFVITYILFSRSAQNFGQEPIVDTVELFAILIFAVAATAAILWESFIKADFFEMPPIRYTRQFLQWLMVRRRQDLLLRMANPASFVIPVPLGEDHLRDYELEALIRSRRWNDAEQYIREKLDFYRTDLTQEHLATGFKVYTHYFKVLMKLRHTYLGGDPKKWAEDIERFKPASPPSN